MAGLHARRVPDHIPHMETNAMTGQYIQTQAAEGLLAPKPLDETPPPNTLPAPKSA